MRERLGPVRVKVCGSARAEDVALALDAGVHALGFLVGLEYASEDALTPARARELVEFLPPFVASVLVTHQTDPDVVCGLCAEVGTNHVQLHGDSMTLQSIEEIRRRSPRIRIIRTVHVDGEQAIERAMAVAGSVDAVLLDTKTGTRLGGTGRVHDWQISRAIRDAVFPRPVILAGGLTPDNVADAIRAVQPYAVDVNSGVSVRRGVTSSELVRAFVERAISNV